MDCFYLDAKSRTKTGGDSCRAAEMADWGGHIHLPEKVLSGSYSLYAMFNIKLTSKP